MAYDQTQPQPRVGIGVMILKDGKVLLGKRKGSHGAGEYAFPGGHLDYMESFEECARRETREETGMEIKNIRFQYLANLQRYAPKHYAHIGLIADWASGEPMVKEPNKCEGWDWYDPDHMPNNCFGTMPLSIDSLKTGKTYYDVTEANRLMG
jgi:8-oxo-dGTP diphosphatase